MCLGPFKGRGGRGEGDSRLLERLRRVLWDPSLFMKLSSEERDARLALGLLLPTGEGA